MKRPSSLKRAFYLWGSLGISAFAHRLDRVTKRNE